MAEPTPAEQFNAKVVARLQDPDELITSAQRDDAVQQALRTYNTHRPRTVTDDLAGADTFDYDLPESWDTTFSSLTQVEYPADQREPQYVDAEDYLLYTTADATQLRFLVDLPRTGETIRLTFTAPHVIDDATSTVPANDADAVADLAASLCCEWLSSRFSQQGEPTLGADSADHTSKARDFALRARAFRMAYYRHLGLPYKEGDTGGGAAASTPVAPASATRSWHTELSTGDPRLTHRRR